MFIMIDGTIELLAQFIILFGTLVTVGYASNEIGRKLYVTCKNNVNGCPDANKRAFKFGVCICIVVLIALTSLQIYIGFQG